MSETFDQYVARILKTLDGKNPLTVLQSSPQKMAKLIKGTTNRQLATAPAPGKWSVGEILAHLAEVELAQGYRLRKIIEEDGAPLHGFDQDAWARNSNYKTADARESLELYRALRAANVRFIQLQHKAAWKRHGVHSQFGKLTFGKILQLVAGHDLTHLQQVARILGRKQA